MHQGIQGKIKGLVSTEMPLRISVIDSELTVNLPVAMNTIVDRTVWSWEVTIMGDG